MIRVCQTGLGLGLGWSLTLNVKRSQRAGVTEALSQVEKAVASDMPWAMGCFIRVLKEGSGPPTSQGWY